jgi:hypothetical protein
MSLTPMSSEICFFLQKIDWVCNATLLLQEVAAIKSTKPRGHGRCSLSKQAVNK